MIGSRKKMNKKGDIPITILVIGVFAICSLALLSFLNSDIQTENSFVGIGLIEKMNSQIEEYSVYKNSENLNIKMENGETFFYQEKREKGKPWELERIDEFPYFKRKEKITFLVKYNLPN